MAIPGADGTIGQQLKRINTEVGRLKSLLAAGAEPQGTVQSVLTVTGGSPVTTVKTATVMLAGAVTPIGVRVPHALMDRVPDGTRAPGAGESLEIGWVNDEYVVTDVIGKAPLIDGNYIDPDTAPLPASDGIPPVSSPDPTVLSGIGIFIGKITPITNRDPVQYQWHVSPTLGFAATFNDPTTLVGTTTGSQFVVKALPGADPAPGAPDPRVLDPDATYYLRVIAFDADGPAPQSLQAVASVFRVTGVDLAADSVTAANIVTGTLTGELFAATVIMAGTFKTAETGQRIETGIAGIQGYKSDGSLMINFPTDPLQTALIDAEIIARGLTVTGGASFQSLQNEVTADAALTLSRGITAPSASPQVSVTYDTVQFSTASLTAAQKVSNDGMGAAFDLVPSEVSCIRWHIAESMWIVYQIRSTGTRKWYFNADGTPRDRYGNGLFFFNDTKDWEIWSECEMTTSTNSTWNGVYTMFRFIPGGQSYYMATPLGLNSYTRLSTLAPPVCGHNGQTYYISEVKNNKLYIGFRAPLSDTGGIPAVPAATTAYETVTAAGYTDSAGIGVVRQHQTGFDIAGGNPRFVVAGRGDGYNTKLLQTVGSGVNSLFPGSAASWTAANKEVESFESPTTNKRCVEWDGTQFWTYGADGYLYKHTAERWDPAVASSTYWTELTFYDSDATGDTHETLPGVIKSYTAKRRSKNNLVVPPIPDNGGTNDPDKIRLYMGRGATQPTNSNMHLQYEGAANTSFTTLATATASPPTSSNFPQTNPAKLRNDDDTMILDGAGNIKGVTLKRGNDNAAIEGPYAYCILSGNHSTAGAAFSNITNWAAEITAFGIVLASGTTLAVPRAGRYKVTLQLSYPTTVTSGSIWADVRKNGAATAAVSAVGNPNTAHSATVTASKTLTLAANDTLQCRSFKSLAGAVNLANAAELTFWQVEWVGP